MSGLSLASMIAQGICLELTSKASFATLWAQHLALVAILGEVFINYEK